VIGQPANEIEVVETVQAVDAVPVLAPEPLRARALYRRPGAFGTLGAVSLAPATQAVAMAAGGFIAGAAVVGLTARRRGQGAAARGRSRRGRPRGRRAPNRAGELVRIVGTRSLLVDVHLLDSAGR